MKKYVLLVALWGLLLSTPANAQGIFGSLLDRYQPQPVAARALSTTPTLSPTLMSLSQDGGLPLRVSDVVRLMLENNINIGVNRFSPTITEYAITSAYQRFDPTLTLSGTATRSTSPSASQLDGAATNSRLTGRYTAAYNHTLAYGTNYSFQMTVNRSSTNSQFSTVNPSYNASLVSSFSQPLLRGRGTYINMGPITIAQNNLELSELQFEQQVMGMVAQAHNLYWDLVSARENIKVQEESLQLANQTLRDNETQVQIGVMAPIDVIQARSEVATRQEGLIQARFNRTRIEDQIKMLVSAVPDPALVLLALNPVEEVRGRTDEVLPVADAIRLALINRPEMRQIELELKNNDINIALAKDQLLPSLNLNASYTQSGLGGTEFVRTGGLGGGTTTVIPGGIGGAFGDIFAFDFTGYSVGFNLQILLSNRAAQASHARVTTQKRLTESRMAATAQGIALEVRNSYNQIEMNRARIDAAQVARELAEERLNAEQRKFRLGASAIRFVLQEQRNLTQAQTSEITALVDYVKAVVAYDQAIGRTLERNNIQIEQQLRPSVASLGNIGVAGP